MLNKRSKKQFFCRISPVFFTLVIAAVSPARATTPSSFLGASLGTPGLINGHVAFYGDHFGFKGSLCFLNILEALDDEEDPAWDDINEPWMFASQMNFEIKIIHQDNFLLTVGAVGGIFYACENYGAKDVFALYAGGALGIILHGLYLEIGFAWISDINANLFNYDRKYIPLVQAGYMVGF